MHSPLIHSPALPSANYSTILALRNGQNLSITAEYLGFKCRAWLDGLLDLDAEGIKDPELTEVDDKSSMI